METEKTITPLPGKVKITMGKSMVDKFEQAKKVSASLKSPYNGPVLMPEKLDDANKFLENIEKPA